MTRFAVLASIVVLAAASANCAQDGNAGPLGSSSSLAPSALTSSGIQLGAAAKGGNGGGKGDAGKTGGYTFALAMVTDLNGDTLPNWGDSVRFDVTTTETTDPRVNVVCSQNGVVVYGGQTGPWSQVLGLSSQAWQSGAASCVAELYYISGGTTIEKLGSISFTAGA